MIISRHGAVTKYIFLSQYDNIKTFVMLKLKCYNFHSSAHMKEVLENIVWSRRLASEKNRPCFSRR